MEVTSAQWLVPAQIATKEPRGRVMGECVLALYNLPPGLLVSGVMFGRVGYHATATFYAVVGLLFTGLIALKWRADLWRADMPANAR